MQYDFSLVANGGQDVNVVGNYIKYKSGLGKIRVRMSAGGYVDLSPGQGIRLKAPFNQFNISDRSGLANQGTILAGDFDFQDDSISGAVSIIDGGKISALQQNCFMGTSDSGAVGANYNYVILGNDPASGKNVIVESIVVSASSVAQVLFTLTNTAVGATGLSYNKAGNLAPVASALMGPGYINNIGLIGSIMMKFYLLANTPVTIKFAEPVIIVPGRSICVANANVGGSITGCFEFREDPV